MATVIDRGNTIGTLFGYFVQQPQKAHAFFRELDFREPDLSLKVRYPESNKNPEIALTR